MGILSRFIQLMKANMFELTNNLSSSGKKIDTIVREMRLDLRTIQSEANAIKAKEQQINREIFACEEEIDKMNKFSQRAKLSGDTAKAKRFSAEMAALEIQKIKLVDTYNLARIETKQIELLEEKVTRDVMELEEQANKLKEHRIELQTQQYINESLSSTDRSFDDYEEQLQYKIDEAHALAELRSNPSVLRDSEKSIDEEIAALTKKE